MMKPTASRALACASTSAASSENFLRRTVLSAVATVRVTSETASPIVLEPTSSANTAP